ncbi:hypothetical protein BDZ91DRAFT_709124, partial [Kalaharituber pfeilii]
MYVAPPHKACKVRQCQVPCSPAFVVTDYKAQGRTFGQDLIDLELYNSFGQHSTFTVVYVELLRCRTLGGLKFLRGFKENTFL